MVAPKADTYEPARIVRNARSGVLDRMRRNLQRLILIVARHTFALNGRVMEHSDVMPRLHKIIDGVDAEAQIVVAHSLTL